MRTVLRIICTVWVLAAATVGHMALLVHVAHVAASPALGASLFASLVLYASTIVLADE